MTLAAESIDAGVVSGPAARRRPGVGARLLFLPMVLWLVLFVLVPNLMMVVYAFLSPSDTGTVEWTFSADAIRRVFDGVWLRIFAVSVGYAALTTVIALILAFPVAWTIGRARPARRSTLVTLVMVPFWTSFLIRTYGWITILKSEGVLNAFLKSVHLIATPVEFLYTPVAVVIGLVHSYLPFMILPIVGSIEKLDEALIEAAADLGAPPLAVFRRIILPLVRPGVAAGVLLVFVPAIGMFAVSDLLGGARHPMIGAVIQHQFGAARDWPFGAALGTVLLLLFSVTFYLTGTKRSDA